MGMPMNKDLKIASTSLLTLGNAGGGEEGRAQGSMMERKGERGAGITFKEIMPVCVWSWYRKKLSFLKD